MPSDEDRVARRLLDMIENIDKAAGFVAGYTYDRFVDDDRTVYAVVRALEIVSEASRHVPEDIKKRHAAIEWQAIGAAGNVYRHGYHGVNTEVVWDTVVRHLGALRTAAVTEVERLGQSGHLPKSE
ncbi:MAG TPA: HepT-like ribonuclease domain-containing protein [Rhizomicrobium sp.]